jgi:hypothetical protein
VRAVPRELRGKLEAAEVFHEVLEHRWYMSERAGRDLPIADTIEDYVRTCCRPSPTKVPSWASTPAPCRSSAATSISTAIPTSISG